MVINCPSPIQPLVHSSVYRSVYRSDEPSGSAFLRVGEGVEIYIKREDLIHPEFGGNKWRKLKYNLEAYKTGGYGHLVTFGGPFSNHIAATASACHHYNIPCTGIIRGSYIDETNPTLLKAKANGMQLKHVAKCDYQIKEKAAEIKDIIAALDNPLVIPEGGNNMLALRGTAEVLEEVRDQDLEPDYIILSGGTGTTASGIIYATQTEKVIVMNALKNSGLTEAIEKNLDIPKDNWMVNEDYHFGRFAKVTQELVDFINGFYKAYGLLLDPLYNGKAMYGLFDLIHNNYFPRGSKILYVYTGGLQGVAAYNYRCKREEMRIIR